MRRLAVAAVICLAGCGGSDKLGSAPPAAPRSLTIMSPDFPANGRDPACASRATAPGRGRRCGFGGVPEGAAELALIVVDPDAGGFVHWTTYGLPANTRALGSTGLPAGAREGENSAGKAGWTPPCPPSGNHRYEFRLYWLKRPSNLDAGAKPEAVDKAVRASAGGSGLLVGRYERR